MITIHKASRVLLDRSALHGDKFEALAKAGLLNLVTAGVLEIYYSSPFLEETLRIAINEKVTFSRQWDYLSHLNPNRWFLYPLEIIEKELGAETESEYYLRPSDDIANTIQMARSLVTGEIAPAEIARALGTALSQRERNDKFKKTRISLREGVVWKASDFPNFFSENVHQYFCDAVFGREADQMITKWEVNRSAYPFTTNLAKVMLAVLFLPVSEHSLRVDVNDKSDAEQLAYLTFADILVSDDKQFMRSCFNLVFAGTGKQLMTSNEFVEWICLQAHPYG